jgi:hypothetical protein
MSEAIISPGVFQIETDQSLYTQGPQTIGAAIVGPTVGGLPFVPTYVTTYNQYLSIFGDIFKSGSYYYEYFTSMAAKEYFANGGQTLLVTRIISGSANISTYASATVPKSGSAAESFKLETLAWGNQMNNTSSLSSGSLASGSAYNVRWEVTNVQTGSGTFTIVVRRGDDNQAQKNILETWANVSLDPQLPNYISRVIGDLKPVANLTTNQIDFTGSYANISRYIRVASVAGVSPDSIDNNGRYKSALKTNLPTVGSGSNGGSFDGGVADTSFAKLMNENITTGGTPSNTDNIQGFSPSDYNTAFSILTNSDDYRYNV